MRVLNAATSERKLALSKDTRCRLAAKIQQGEPFEYQYFHIDSDVLVA